MVTERDLDLLMQTIQSGSSAYLYYVAHEVELREGYVDELAVKSNPKFRIVKTRVTAVNNALFEYQNYQSHPNNYQTESETTYPDTEHEYVFYYTIPKNQSSYNKPFNPRMPSVIYGTRRHIYRGTTLISQYNDPSPVKEVYTNNITYGDYSHATALSNFNTGKLNWKYKKLSTPVVVDGISFSYLTSDWYILDVDLPRTEKPLVNIKQKTAYFTSLENAYSYLKELSVA